MHSPSVRLRPGEPTMADGILFAGYLDQAAEGFFRFMLGPRAIEILAEAFAKPSHDLSYENVTFVERDTVVVGMVSGYTATQHRRSSLQPLRDAAGGWRLRMSVVMTLFAPLLRIIDSIADNDFYLQAIAIDKPLRGGGLGGLLLDTIEEKAIGQAAKRLVLDVSTGNPGAIRVYQHHGMRIDSQWPKRIKIPGFRLYRMTKDLPSSAP